MPSENSAKIFFDRALNRPRESRGSQPSACFCGTFCTPQKVPTRTPLQGDSRFSRPRISPPKQQLPTNKIKTFPKGASRFFEPQISTPKIHFCTSPIKSFCRSAAFPPPLAALFFVADATNLCASRYYRRLRRFFSALRRCPCRDSTLRVLVGSLYGMPTAVKKEPPGICCKDEAFDPSLIKVLRSPSLGISIKKGNVL